MHSHSLPTLQIQTHAHCTHLIQMVNQQWRAMNERGGSCDYCPRSEKFHIQIYEDLLQLKYPCSVACALCLLYGPSIERQRAPKSTAQIFNACLRLSWAQSWYTIIVSIPSIASTILPATTPATTQELARLWLHDAAPCDAELSNCNPDDSLIKRMNGIVIHVFGGQKQTPIHVRKPQTRATR